MLALPLLALALSSLLALAEAAAAVRRHTEDAGAAAVCGTYREGEPVTLWASEPAPRRDALGASPPSNASALLRDGVDDLYGALPWCEPTNFESRREERLVKAPHMLRFRRDAENVSLCEMRLSRAHVEQFAAAIAADYVYELAYDHLSATLSIGALAPPPASSLSARGLREAAAAAKREESALAAEGPKPYLSTHIEFAFSYHGAHLIEMHARPTTRVLMDASAVHRPVQFTYSARWQPTDVTCEQRSLRFRGALAEQAAGVRPRSVLHACLSVLLLAALATSMFVRMLQRDIARHARSLDAVEESFHVTVATSASARAGSGGGGGEVHGSHVLADDSGWKMLHGDVFRFPPHRMLFCAMLGAGAQLLALVGAALLLAAITTVATTAAAGWAGAERALLTAVAGDHSFRYYSYALSSLVAGCVAGRMYKLMEGRHRVRCALLTAAIFGAPALLTHALLRALAWWQPQHDAQAASPADAMTASSVAACALLAVALTLLGAVVGRRTAPTHFNAPCRTMKIPREIPPPAAAPISARPTIRFLLAGALPFGAVYSELLFVFGTVCTRAVHGMYTALFAVFAVVALVSALMSAALVYYQLCAEDHRWWWRALAYGGAVSVYIYMYGAVYARAHAQWDGGWLQLAFYHGRMLLASYALFLMLGALGVALSLAMIRHLYRTVKFD